MKSIFLSSQTIQQQMQNKTKFKIKNVLKANGGKEFTIKVTNNMFKKCLDKYSGGPETIPNLKQDMDNLIKENKLDVEGFVNFYELVEKNTGNSYLHIATRGNYYELVKKLFKNGKALEEKDIKIEGYDLNNFDLENIKNVEFQSFCEDNFVIFYRHKEN